MLQSNGRKNLQKKKINETQKFKFNPFRISRKNVLDLPFYGSLGQTLYFSLKKQKKPLKKCLYRPCQFLAWSNFISIFKKKQEKTGKTFEFPCVTQLSIYQIFFFFPFFCRYSLPSATPRRRKKKAAPTRYDAAPGYSSG